MKPVPTDPWAEALAFVLRREGGYVNDPADPGGPTNMGITQKTWESWLPHRPPGPGVTPTVVGDITQRDAAEVYRARYWLAAGCGKLSWPMSLFVFDAAVNCGVGQAKKWHGPSPDYLEARRQFYHDLVAKRPRLGKFLAGWLKRCDALAEYL